MADSDGDKTEQATDRHRGEAFEKGQFARTPELSVVLMLTAALAIFAFTAQTASEQVAKFSISTFTRFASTPIRIDTVVALLGEVTIVLGRVLGPVLAATMGAALLAGGLQTGFQLTPKVIGLNFDRLNPAAGFNRVFSRGALVHTGIDFLKLVAIGGSLYIGGRALVHDPIFSSPVETIYLGRFISHATASFLSRVIMALGAITALSFTYERFKTAKELMMSRQEVKDERRSTEGDGMVKGNRRRMARRLMQKQMLEAIATADVIITNPTHFAVALKYERGKDRAPVVLAKGENRFAMRIKELAADHGVPLVENKPVARMLFAMGKVGEAIPPELYQAVAQILAVVYRTHRYYFHRLKARRVEASA